MGLTRVELEVLVVLGRIPHETGLRSLTCLSGYLSHIAWWVDVMDLGLKEDVAIRSGRDCETPKEVVPHQWDNLEKCHLYNESSNYCITRD